MNSTKAMMRNSRSKVMYCMIAVVVGVEHKSLKEAQVSYRRIEDSAGSLVYVLTALRDKTHQR